MPSEDSVGGLRHVALVAWKEQIIMIAHAVPFILGAYLASQVFDATAIGFAAVLYCCLRGGEWLMGRWYEGEVYCRDE